MQEASPSPLWPKIILPLFIAAALRVAPQAVKAATEFRQVAWAEAHASPGAAVGYLATISEILPWRSDLLERAGHDALQNGDTGQAIWFLSTARAEGELSNDGLNDLAQANFQAGNITVAVELWTMLTQTTQAPVEVYSALATAAVKLDNLHGAISHLQAGLTLYPDNPDLLFYQGKLLAIEQPDQALPVLLKLASVEPDLDAPVRELQAALNSAPADAEPAYRLVLTGRGLASISDWDLAAVAFQKAVDARPDYADAWAFLGEAQQQIGADGLADLQHALEINPKSVLTQALMAVYWQRQGDDAEAQTHLAAAAELEPENPIWQVELGGSLAKTGDLDGAAACFQKAIEIAPENVSYWKALAEFSIENGYQLEEVGLPAARQTAVLDPDKAEGYDLMGQAFLKSGDNLSAQRILEEALNIDPDYIQARLHLGIAYLYQDENDKAYDCFAQIYTLTPESWEGEQAKYYLDNFFLKEP